MLHDLNEERDREILLKSFQNTMMSGLVHSCAIIITTTATTILEVIYIEYSKTQILTLLVTVVGLDHVC